jgi:thioredoxin 1
MKEKDMPVLEITSVEFQEKIIEGSKTKPAVVDFWAPWCGPCRMVSPVLEELSEEMSEKLNFFKLNTDENQQTASQFGVMSIPTIMLFKDGEPVERIIGATTKNNFKEKLETHLTDK